MYLKCQEIESYDSRRTYICYENFQTPVNPEFEKLHPHYKEIHRYFKNILNDQNNHHYEILKHITALSDHMKNSRAPISSSVERYCPGRDSKEDYLFDILADIGSTVGSAIGTGLSALGGGALTGITAVLDVANMAGKAITDLGSSIAAWTQKAGEIVSKISDALYQTMVIRAYSFIQGLLKNPNIGPTLQKLCPNLLKISLSQFITKMAVNHAKAAVIAIAIPVPVPGYHILPLIIILKEIASICGAPVYPDEVLVNLAKSIDQAYDKKV